MCHFPGNIRELRNILHAAAAACHTKHIDMEQLQRVLAPSMCSIGSQQFLKPNIPIEIKDENQHQEQQSLADMEQEQIILLLKQFSGNRKQVASHLGISVRTLYRKLNKYTIRYIKTT